MMLHLRKNIKLEFYELLPIRIENFFQNVLNLKVNSIHLHFWGNNRNPSHFNFHEPTEPITWTVDSDVVSHWYKMDKIIWI
jgi:hypothetical protein